LAFGIRAGSSIPLPGQMVMDATELEPDVRLASHPPTSTSLAYRCPPELTRPQGCCVTDPHRGTPVTTDWTTSHLLNAHHCRLPSCSRGEHQSKHAVAVHTYSVTETDRPREIWAWFTGTRILALCKQTIVMAWAMIEWHIKYSGARLVRPAPGTVAGGDAATLSEDVPRS
jgi:hypothetical protein